MLKGALIFSLHASSFIIHGKQTSIILTCRELTQTCFSSRVQISCGGMQKLEGETDRKAASPGSIKCDSVMDYILGRVLKHNSQNMGDEKYRNRS